MADHFRNSRMYFDVRFRLFVSVFLLVGCQKSNQLEFGKTKLDSVIAQELSQSPLSASKVEKWPSPDQPNETLRFTGPGATSKTYSAQNGIVIGLHREPLGPEKTIAYWLEVAAKNKWSYSVVSAEQSKCGHMADEIMRIPKQGLSVRFNSETGLVERIAQSEQRHAH